MTILVTGYEPFGDYEKNPSAALAESIDGEMIADHEVVGRILPVEFDRTSDELTSLVDDYEPTVAVSTGLAPGAAGVRVERVGINVNDCMGIPDNADATPRHERIRDDADAYFATLPVAEVVEALLDAGVPSRLSNTAGTHLCNNALYTTRAHVESEGLDVRSGFLHLPFTPDQAAERTRNQESVSGGGDVPPSLPLSVQRTAVETAIEATVSEP